MLGLRLGLGLTVQIFGLGLEAHGLGFDLELETYALLQYM